ncbi:MAG: nickel pincer cofactor biosynthesis protein LarC [Roseiflexaceae bacterium]
MSNVIYFDCFSGISGDMILGALCDAGLDIAQLRSMLSTLPVDGWSIDATREVRGWLSGTRMHVIAPEQDSHRHLHDVAAIIQASQLPTHVKNQAMAIFTTLAEAEAHIHGVTREQVHFHEVGALDAIVDIVGIVAGLSLLGITHVYASALPLGNGWVKAAHGDIPVPAPATLHLLSQAKAPIIPDQANFELVTPTGAAVLATLAEFRRPAMNLARIGYGFGKKQTERPNALRVWLGNTAAPSETLVLIECNIDDQTPEQLAYVCERLMRHGARDVWQTSIMMKKGRVAVQLSLLCDADREAELVDILLRESSTLGMRRQLVERHVAARDIESVATPYGTIRVKHKRWQGQLMTSAPEYDDCASAAQQHNVPIHQVYHAVHMVLQQREIRA